jgi:outer membrane receptor protein involved in Fe transport
MVVSIFTREVPDGRFEILAGGGEHDRVSLGAIAAVRAGRWHFQVSGSHEAEGDRQQPGQVGREVKRLRWIMRRDADGARSLAQVSVVTATGVVFSVLGSTDLRDTLFADLLVSHRDEDWEAQISFGVGDLGLPLQPDVIYQGNLLGRTPGLVELLSTNLDAQGQAFFRPWDGSLLIAGGNYRWIGAFSDHIAPSSIHQHRVGAFLQLEQRLVEVLTLTGGVRLDYNNITPFTVSPRAACVWSPIEDQFLRLSFGQAFRKPSFFNTSIHLTGVEPEPAFPEFDDFMHRAVGNEELKNESITSLELGYVGRFLGRDLTLEADVFYNRYRDTITFHLDIVTGPLGLPDLDASEARYTNAGREADSVGATLAATFRILEPLRVHLNYTFRHTFYTSDPTGLGTAEGGRKGERISWEPAHLANLSVRWVPATGLRLGVSLHARSAFDGQISQATAFDPRDTMHLPAAFLLSAFASWRFDLGARHLEAGVRAYNALQAPFRDLPGRIRLDGFQLGGQELPRRIFLFLRGSL